MMRAMLLKATPRAKAAGVVDALIRYNPWARRRVLRVLTARHANFSLEERIRLSDSLTAKILAAARNTPYGAEHGTLYADWPVLEKETLAATPGRFVNRVCVPRFPAGTGGTTGLPVQLWRSLECIVAEQAFLDDLLAPYGFAMRESRVAVLRGDSVKSSGDHAPPYGKILHDGRRLLLSSQHLRPETFSWYVEELRRFAPDVLWVYPNAALNLLTLADQADLQLVIPIIMASSEMLPRALHEGLMRRFCGTVINYYGQAERVCLAVGTEPGVFRFDPCYGKVELRRTQDETTGAPSAAIIGTGFWNRAMPLVRYHTGDLALLPPECDETMLKEITLGLRSFPGLAGREGEYLLTRDGMRIIGLNQIPREVKNVFQLQLVQTGFESLIVNVAAMPGFTAQDAKQILDNARAKIPSSIAVEVKVVPQLMVNTRGKAPFVIRQTG